MTDAEIYDAKMAAKTENPDEDVPKSPEDAPKSPEGVPKSPEDMPKSPEGAPNKANDAKPMGTECSECGKPAKFYSIYGYDRDRVAFCSAECHSKRNEKTSMPNLMLVEIGDDAAGSQKSDDSKSSTDQTVDELVEAATEDDIFDACHGGLTNNRILHKLLEGGADVNQKDSNDQSLLFTAVANGDVTTLNLLLEKNADVNERGKGQATPLMIAAEMGLKEKVSFLLGKEADTTLKDEDGKTALHRTEKNRNTKCAELLIEKNPELLQATDNFKQTVLHQAAGEGNKELMTLLLEREADTAALDNLNRSPLHWAVIQGMESVVEFLVAHDCEKVINEPDRFGVRPIHYAIQSNRMDIAEMLIQKGCELEVGESRGLTALIYAAACGKTDMLNLIIPNCKNIDITDTQGWTALHHAAKRGDAGVCKLLLDHKANLGVRDSKQDQTPLFTAVNNKHLDVVKLFVERDRESCSVKDGKERLALHYAAETGQIDILGALVENEVKSGSSEQKGNDAEESNLINTKDNSGHTALYLAARNRHRSCCQHLIDHDASVDDQSRGLLFNLGLIQKEEEKEEEEEEERDTQSPRERYGLDEKGKSDKIEDLDLSGLTDTSAVALNSRYIYEGLGPPPKSTTPRRTNSKSSVVPRRSSSDNVDPGDAFNVQWKELLDKKRRAEMGYKARRSEDYHRSPYTKPLVSEAMLKKHNVKMLPPPPHTSHALGRPTRPSKNSAATVAAADPSSRAPKSDEQNGGMRENGRRSRPVTNRAQKQLNMSMNVRTTSGYNSSSDGSKKYSYSVVTR